MRPFIPLVILVVCGVAYYMYISPTLAEVQGLRSKKAEYTEVLNKTKEITELRDASLKTYNSISREDIDRLNKVVPSSFDPVALATSINTTASRYGMVIRAVKIQKEATNQSPDAPLVPFKTTKLSFTVKGQYEQLSQFLKELENNIHLVDVTMLSASNDDKNNPNSAYQFSIEVKTYSLN